MLCIVSDGIWACKCSGQKLHSSTFLQLHDSFKDTANSTKCPKRVYSNISTSQMVYILSLTYPMYIYFIFVEFLTLYIYSILYLSSASRHIWSRLRTPPCLAISLQRWLPSKARFISWSMDNFKTLFDFLSLSRSTLNCKGKTKNMVQVYKP